MKFIYLILTIILSLNSLLADSKYGEIHATILKLDQKTYLAVGLKNQKDWHTYWINPGEAGIATKIEFFLDPTQTEIKIPEEHYVRPAPVKFSEGAKSEVVIYGHKDEHIFYYDFIDFKNYVGSTIKIRGTWLICKEICINEQNEIKIKLTLNGLELLSPQSFSLTNDQYSNHFKKIPINSESIPKELSLYLSVYPQEKKFVLNYEYTLDQNILNPTELVDFFKNNNLLYPYPLIPFGFKREKLYVSANQPNTLFGRVDIDWDGEYQDPPQAIPLEGKFSKPYTFKFLFNPIKLTKNGIVFSQPQIIKTEIQAFSVNPNNEIVKSLTELNHAVVNQQPVQAKVYPIYIYYLLALLGGFILNFMPCVLPVISLKLFELIKSATDNLEKSKKRIFEHNLFYSLGVLSCFQILAIVIVLIKSQGENASWGFQLQNPYFVTVMIFVLFIFSLNLFGLFEFGTPFGNKLGNVKIPSNIGGDFLGGVLTTVLSTPCSAPFLGSALTFAFFSPTIHIFGIFFSIGTGLCLPFLITALMPKLVYLLPRPGKWMLLIKKIMGGSLLLTIVWLLDVLSSLVSAPIFYISFSLALICIFTYFLFKHRWIKLLLLLLFLITTIFTFIKTEKNLSSSDLVQRQKGLGLNWEKWSVEKMEEYKKSQDLVFFDFTAKWCFNCKINEKLVLETEAFKKLVTEHKLKLLLADWTNHDDKISQFLNSFKIVGVPAYFVQKRDGSIISLGETISIEKISSALETK